MGLWNAIKNAVKSVANVVEKTFNAAGNAIATVFETVGNGISDGLNKIGEVAGIKFPFAWLGRVIKGAFSLTGANIKGQFGILGATAAGQIKIIGGILTLQPRLIFEGVGGILSSWAGNILVIGGKAIGGIQSIFYLQDFERPLTDSEENLLRRVFKDSLDYYSIRIVDDRAGIFGVTPNAFTLGNTIYMKNTSFSDDLLVHEAVHVWQYQKTGSRYATDALYAQFFDSSGYYWKREVNQQKKSNWVDFNYESQAQFFQDLWKNGELIDYSSQPPATIRGNGSFFEQDGENKIGQFQSAGVDYTEIALQAVRTIRRPNSSPFG